ncbi:MAG: hypothetical protein FWD55_08730 [Propionibacteriaceae bacterium]|nr:hypothetical protein [Propionibacteriaceae bacterium]
MYKTIRKVVLLAVSATLAFSIIGIAPQAQAADIRARLTTNGVALRAGPGTGYEIIDRGNTTSWYTFDCWKPGTAVIGNNNKWNKLKGVDTYIYDYYVANGGKTLADSGLRQCATGSGYSGWLDSITERNEGMSRYYISVKGWAVYWGNPQSATVVSVYVDGVYKASNFALTSRPDVNNALPGVGPNHGFEVKVFGLSCGKHTLTVKHTNTNQVLNGGTKTFTMQRC